MIQTLEEMVRRLCAYGLEFKDCYVFTHDWFTLLPALELEYKTSIHAITNQTPAILEKGWNPKLPQDSLRKDLVEINPTAASFKGMLEIELLFTYEVSIITLVYCKTQFNYICKL
ncbi:hypothetical protein O181_116986 [Austropuccinia psidii MF-1]|uniref:Uncharacterized protein n=1 Tax=Austropuccinia psidii MF-1 TaxID=1389203 RepID=A0A9Q3KBU5_9BASI|nr:hypothetical protein [Austropuccinia psidii MF-1]